LITGTRKKGHGRKKSKYKRREVKMGKKIEAELAKRKSTHKPTGRKKRN